MVVIIAFPNSDHVFKTHSSMQSFLLIVTIAPMGSWNTISFAIMYFLIVVKHLFDRDSVISWWSTRLRISGTDPFWDPAGIRFGNHFWTHSGIRFGTIPGPTLGPFGTLFEKSDPFGLNWAGRLNESLTRLA